MNDKVDAQLREVAKILSLEICGRGNSAIFTPDFIFSSALRRIKAADIAEDAEWFAYSTGATFVFAHGVTLAEFLTLYSENRIEFRLDPKLGDIVEKGYIIVKRSRDRAAPPAST